MDRLDKYVSVVPSARQVELEKMGYYAFIHYGINTYLDKEWSDGKASPSLFNPTNLDTDKWCEIIKAAGMKGVILTAKHHDGFCLWQTDTTEYSIKNSPYKDGKGDIVAELSASCKKYDIKFGVYLSPWDRNSEYYGTPKYNDFYIEQLTELLTRYGDIFELWLDGACGSHLDGKAKQIYDFTRIYAKCRELQPNCIIANCGPDVRWIGNEGGLTRESEWNVLPATNADNAKIMDASQTDDGSPKFDAVKEDLGSRKELEGHDDFIWYPAEVDVSIRPGWFYHASQDSKVRTAENLLDIYYSSVGGNANLLLNIPPTKEGIIHENDERELRRLGEYIKSGLGKEVKFKTVSGSEEKPDYKIANIVKGGVYSPKLSDKYALDINFKEISKIDKVMICEDITHSQRIENFEIFIKYRGRSKRVYKGTTVGVKKIALFKKWTYADGICLLIQSCRKEPYIEKFAVFEADGNLPKQHNLRKKIKKAIHAYGYKQYVKAIDRQNKRLQKKNACKVADK